MAAEVRQNLVEEAKKFLSNPKVITEKNENKRAFLQKKGLTEEEINIAFSMAPTNVIISGSASSPAFGPPVPYIPHQPTSRWLQIRDFANLILILSGASYGIHYIYKFYIGPLLTGRQEKSIEESMIELQQSVVSVLKDVQSTLSTMEQTLSVQSTKIQALTNEKTTDAATKRQLDELKTEITSLKGLLVNKRSFPATPSLSAGIPSWQLSSGSSSTLSAISNSTVNNTSSVASSMANESSTNDLNILSNITNGHDNSSTENGLVDDDTVVKVAVTNASIISTTNANKINDTQVTVKNTEIASTEKDEMNSHSNDLIKTDLDDTSEKKETVEDAVITDSSDEISQ